MNPKNQNGKKVKNKKISVRPGSGFAPAKVFTPPPAGLSPRQNIFTPPPAGRCHGRPGEFSLGVEAF